MGGEQRIEDWEAASILDWWVQSGVDVAVQDEPRNWLSGESETPLGDAGYQQSKVAGLPEPTRRASAAPSEIAEPRAAATAPAIPKGAEDAPLMLFAEAPGSEVSGGKSGSGETWQLTQRMMRAIGVDPEAAYCAALSCAPAPGGRLSAEELKACGATARGQVAAARPRRLLIMGEAACRAILNKGLSEARGHVHAIEGVRTVATFDARFLIRRPSYKALAWQDLLLLMEDEG